MTDPNLDCHRTLYAVLRLLNEANIPGEGVIDQVKALVEDNARLNAERERMAARPNADRVREMIDADRSELLALMADDALDRGEEAEALGYRWLAMRRKWPAFGATGWVWATDKPDVAGTCIDIPICFCLPDALVTLVWHPDQYQHGVGYVWPTCSAALEAVVAAFVAGWREPRKEKTS